MTALSSESAPSATLPPAERRISRRVASIAESATLAVDARAKALKAAGRPVIGFGAGEPDFPTPDYILRAAIAAKTRRDSGVEIAPEQVLVTNGGKQAVYQAFATLLDPGDEVLLP